MKAHHFFAQTALLLIAAFCGQLYAEHLTYQHDIYPLLEERCLACHHNPGAPNGLSLESYTLMMKGSINGPVVIAGDSSASELVMRIRGDKHPQMPMNGPPFLNELEMKLISSWIDAGARP